MSTLPDCQTLSLRQYGAILHLTLDRPESRNAMSLDMVREMSTVFDQIAADCTIRAIILRGAGGHFCAGGDIRDMAAARSQKPGAGKDPFRDLNRAFGRLIQQVNEAPQVVIAVLEGAVMGGGFGLACVSDLAIAAENARFAMPETSLGIIPAQIAPFVVERIGLTQARRLALLGLKIDGAEAQRLGIVHQVVENESALAAATDAAIDQLIRCAPQATAATKALLHQAGTVPMSDLLDEAAQQFAETVRGEEGAEGTLAFMQKRPPAWAAKNDT
ncbi:isohexenylglutaconyl-CoA hydratase [Marinobacter nanhaiticus D15-8W]|uniref:Enoyl-CoA hydratase/isomerase family protein n=1 Tax=Marinobacter nanhaiticus D15-8W TaxID=626887 RepID=N6WP16_9GAMM|nr:enoyl-CoA hydratase-related protein [Marinobacter nanhaiticus]ENO13271.1 enoyl-CoA hydratase/isomerase family protein [Marinobacter nanhaiticus D15-8W]BES70635.1 isohexenylglutaconyl-CoA hydratase [Marinobacter nanhaiticus D15-8W]